MAELSSQRVSFNMERALHKDLKMLALEQDTTVTDLLTDCARQLVAARKQPDRTTEDKAVYDTNPD